MLHYNENKVNAGDARLILSSGFAGDIEKIDLQQKLQRFQHLTELKPNVKTNAVHISLNFHSSEKLDTMKLQKIAADYMDRIGLGDQPFLVYSHHDAAHQHVHITSTNITPEGKRIDLHDIGKLLSEPARKAIELEYELIKAESKQIKQESPIKAADLEAAKYGQLPTKRAISNVITAVTRDYKFTTLAEYNAVLKCFNVIALRGAEHTAMFEKKGLMFSLMDKNQKPVGVPIKSSAFYSKPTLRNLEKKFEQSTEKRKAYRENVKQRIDKVLKNHQGISRQIFEAGLKKQGIQVAFRQNEQGLIFGVTFVDHRSGTVFNGSDLGKAYSAKSITERFTQKDIPLKQERKAEIKLEKSAKEQKANRIDTFLSPPKPAGFLKIALDKTAEEGGIKIPKRKKKRRKVKAAVQELSIN